MVQKKLKVMVHEKRSEISKFKMQFDEVGILINRLASGNNILVT